MSEVGQLTSRPSCVVSTIRGALQGARAPRIDSPLRRTSRVRPVRRSHQISRRGRMNRILITGAAGKIGNTLREGLRGRYASLRLSDVAPLDPAGPGEEIVRADLTDLASVEAAMRDVDCVVHLGAVPGE